jgi:hypothetical protein
VGCTAHASKDAWLEVFDMPYQEFIRRACYLQGLTTRVLRAAYIAGPARVRAQCSPAGLHESCECGVLTWRLTNAVPATVFTHATIDSTLLEEYACSGCDAKLTVDGNEHLILLKGKWASPTFYGTGEFRASYQRPSSKSVALCKCFFFAIMARCCLIFLYPYLKHARLGIRRLRAAFSGQHLSLSIHKSAASIQRSTFSIHQRHDGHH